MNHRQSSGQIVEVDALSPVFDEDDRAPLAGGNLLQRGQTFLQASGGSCYPPPLSHLSQSR